MSESLLSQNPVLIQKRIYTIRGLQMMLDLDLAMLYGVEIKVLNQSVKCNIERFPNPFRFQLTEDEYNHCSNAKTKRGQNIKYLPYAFTEQGVSMLSALLRSRTAVQISIQIINAFVEMRKFMLNNVPLFQRIEGVEQKQLQHRISSGEEPANCFMLLQKAVYQCLPVC